MAHIKFKDLKVGEIFFRQSDPNRWRKIPEGTHSNVRSNAHQYPSHENPCFMEGDTLVRKASPEEISAPSMSATIIDLDAVRNR